ncbi:hypothetical protein, partial [Neobacillus cucumis]|uniref:hypothetical protein n=1 Tax=Neobacillus cucumis TaxID=1740721 RepID=UPI002E21E0FA|nr:hypothetical protein [Neobacillus cucumis]
HFIKFKTECHLFLLAQNEKLKKRKFFSALAEASAGSPLPRTPAGVERLPFQSTSYKKNNIV